MNRRCRTAFAAFAAAFLVVSGVQAADLKKSAHLFAPPDPAVSGSNFKIDGFGGTLSAPSVPNQRSSGGLGGVHGAFSVPLGPAFGLQGDGFVGSWGGDTFGGGAGHLFWRDPSNALFGLYTSYTRLDRAGGVSVGKVAAEFELYRGPFTFDGYAGWEGGDVRSRFTSKINATYYVHDDLRLSIGHRYTGGINLLALGGEVAIPLATTNAVSAFVEGRVGENNYNGVWGGLRVYFGERNKPLKERHRRDDPGTDPVDGLIPAQVHIQNTNASSTAASVVTCPDGFILVGGVCVGL